METYTAFQMLGASIQGYDLPLTSPNNGMYSDVFNVRVKRYGGYLLFICKKNLGAAFARVSHQQKVHYAHLIPVLLS